MSDRIPIIATNRVSDNAKKTLDLIKKFVEERCIPCVIPVDPHPQIPQSPSAFTSIAKNPICDPVVAAQVADGASRWDSHPSVIEDLKEEAKKLGLWNMFLTKGQYKESLGFTNLEYGLMAEWLGKSKIAPEAVNCAAPDTGNMEVLAKYGNDAQKAQWLKPLMEGKIRSAFLMTEPDVASSDATNIQMSMRKEGSDWVLNGQKWWSSGAGDPSCQIYIVMAKSDPLNKDPYIPKGTTPKVPRLENTDHINPSVIQY